MKETRTSFTPGREWLDADGRRINAHGGGILYHSGVYYWYGEERPDGPSSQNALIGVSCYSSTDLYNWKREGTVLRVSDESGHPLEAGCKIERPKVIYNEGTGKFILWWHHDLKGWGHAGALAGVAVSDSPTGPFSFIEVLRPNGRMFRDSSLFKDEDGAAYLVFASDANANLVFCRLDDSYLKPTDRQFTCFRDRYQEAPCVFKRGGVYYFIGSDCTGWAPNEARSAFAPELFCDWKELGNPCLGQDAETTYGAQSTFVLPVEGKPDTFIFMADRWVPDDLAASTYVWLPIEFRQVPGRPVPRPFVNWREEWRL